MALLGCYLVSLHFHTKYSKKRPLFHLHPNVYHPLSWAQLCCSVPQVTSSVDYLCQLPNRHPKSASIKNPVPLRQKGAAIAMPRCLPAAYVTGQRPRGECDAAQKAGLGNYFQKGSELQLPTLLGKEFGKWPFHLTNLPQKVILFQNNKASVLMQRQSYRTETVLSNKIINNKY